MKYVVGQQVFYAPYDDRRKSGRLVTIESVGRKWVRCDAGRIVFDASTGIEDGRGYSPSGRVFGSEKEYLDNRLVTMLLTRLRNLVPYSASNLSPEDIRAAAALLKIKIEDEAQK